MRILIAEDDQVLADGLLRSLRASGYAVDQVSTGTEADAALAAHEFDLVILDLGLPRMHGFEVLRKLRGIVDPTWRAAFVAVDEHAALLAEPEVA